MGRPDGGMNVEADSLVALLRRWTGEDPTAELFSFLPDGDPAGETVLTRGDLDLHVEQDRADRPSVGGLDRDREAQRRDGHVRGRGYRAELEAQGRRRLWENR